MTDPDYAEARPLRKVGYDLHRMSEEERMRLHTYLLRHPERRVEQAQSWITVLEEEKAA